MSVAVFQIFKNILYLNHFSNSLYWYNIHLVTISIIPDLFQEVIDLYRIFLFLDYL